MPGRATQRGTRTSLEAGGATRKRGQGPFRGRNGPGKASKLGRFGIASLE